VTKTYLAVVEGAWPDDSGEWEDWLIKDERTNVVDPVSPGTLGAHRANVSYRVVDRRAGSLTIELRPTTGRGHQLRVQLASRGLPIAGDRKYGARSTLLALDGRPRIALHALELRFRHPTRPEHLAIAAPMPADWPSVGGSSGRP
jgi:23S rRNA pseudouridine1911/1915/1917 synthase